MPSSKTVSLRRILLAARRLAAVFREDRLSLYAAESSFFVVISVIPFLIVLFAASRFVAPVSESDVLRALTEFLPTPDSELLGTVAAEISAKASVPLFSLSLLTALWSASRGTLAVTEGLSNVYGRTASRGYILDKCRSVGQTLLIVALLLSALLAGVFGKAIGDALRARGAVLSEAVDWLFRVRGAVLFFLLTLFFALLYRSAGRLSLLSQFPGALASAGGWILFSYFYALYLRSFPGASYVYGSLAAIVLLMLWLYACMNILLFGAEINKFLHRFMRLSKQKAPR